MNAPDKIYLYPDIGDREFIRSCGIRAVTTDAVCYINKDMLLELFEGKKKHYMDRQEYDCGWNDLLDDIIEKLESL